MSKTYFTITGLNHYYGGEFFKRKMVVKLKKEPDNEYDSEAIMVKVKGIGKVGYVANSPYTVLGESMSAGRLYDRIGKQDAKLDTRCSRLTGGIVSRFRGIVFERGVSFFTGVSFLMNT